MLLVLLALAGAALATYCGDTCFNASKPAVSICASRLHRTIRYNPGSSCLFHCNVTALSVGSDCGCPNDCGDNGSCQQGACVCQAGWTGGENTSTFLASFSSPLFPQVTAPSLTARLLPPVSTAASAPSHPMALVCAPVRRASPVPAARTLFFLPCSPRFYPRCSRTSQCGTTATATVIRSLTLLLSPSSASLCRPTITNFLSLPPTSIPPPPSTPRCCWSTLRSTFLCRFAFR